MRVRPEHLRSGHLESTYTVEGFRSLVDFQVSLRPGLNILVGPNGSGKTNFIEFLDFLDKLVISGAASAVSSVGGISRVFSQEHRTRQSLKLSASVCTTAYLTENDSPVGPSPCFRFQYSVNLAFNKSTSSLYISSESIKFFHLSSLAAGLPSWTMVGVIGVTRSSRSDDLAPRVRIGGRLLEESPNNPFSIKQRYASSRSIGDILQRGIFESMAPDESLLVLRSLHPALDAVRNAITRGLVFNVIPDKVRESDDITRPPGIARDGSGLTSTLYHLQELGKGGRRRRLGPMRRATPSTITNIRSWTTLVLRELTGISIEQDPHSGKYIGYLKVAPGLSIPFRSISDGTLKWLSLVTMVLTNSGVFSVEEPENFLHPRMQKYLVSLIRESISDRSHANHCVVSTHSETLLNQCDPTELLLFRFLEGKTQCHRLKDPERVQEEIESTGFGLGHYYAANALS